MMSRPAAPTERPLPGSDISVLISGAGVAGLTAAYWLAEAGFHPILIEREPSLPKRGHAVDLWGNAVEILARMGIEEEVSAKAICHRIGVTLTARHRTTVDLDRLSADIHPRHIEIMRSHLIACLADAVGGRATWIFGRTIRSVDQAPDAVRVTLDDGAAYHGAILVGADGVGSAVREHTFDVADWAERPLDIALGVWTGPVSDTLGSEIIRYVAPGRTLAAFRIKESGRTSILTLVRGERSATGADRRRSIGQHFSAAPPHIAALARSASRAPDFHGDTVRTIEMHRWHRGRAALVGDAGFAPGAAVGGGTSLAILTAYRLARGLRPGAEPEALARYSRDVTGLGDAAAGIGAAMADALVPRSHAAAWATAALPPLIARLPSALRNRIPILPRRARNGLRAIAHHSLGDLP